MKKSWIEKKAESLRNITRVDTPPPGPTEGASKYARVPMNLHSLENFPPPERWEDWE